MNDSFVKGLRRAIARKQYKQEQKSLARTKPVSVTDEAASGFDELTYQSTIRLKMIELIHKQRGVNNG